METLVQQNFNPPLKVKHKGEVVSIPTRNWTIGEVNETSDHIENMGDMGSRQIEEVWKYYDKEIYVSNYGYVAEICDAEIEKEFAKFENGEEIDFKTGVIYRSLSDKQKAIIKKRNFVPTNKINSGCEIWLYVPQLGYDKGQVHKMVAEKFLDPKPEECKNLCVHHIDNNSYNNNVTNLVYVDCSEHFSKTKTFHPMSQ